MSTDEDEFAPPSKSQRKREAREITELGQALIELDSRERDQLPLDDQLADAVAEAARIRSYGARKRQMLYVGRLMRNRELEAIREALDQLQSRGKADQARFKRLEDLRDQLIGNGDEALAQVFERYPRADRQHLRRLLRDIQRESRNAKPPAANRELFRYLRELDDNVENAG